MPKLSILICTIDSRVTTLPDILLSERTDVEYVVSVQYTDEKYLAEIPQILKDRPDVKIFTLAGRGLSRNRNNALAHCTTPLALISDDDVRYTHAYLDAVIEAFAVHSTADIITFNALDASGNPLREYSPYAFDYEHQPRGNYYISFEIALRLSERIACFDERFGLGADYLCAGEEDVFLYDSRKRGAKILSLPITACYTLDSATTGTFFLTEPRVRRSKGAVHCVLHGQFGAYIRMIHEVMCIKAPLRKRIAMLKDTFAGIHYIAKAK